MLSLHEAYSFGEPIPRVYSVPDIMIKALEAAVAAICLGACRRM